MLFGSDLFEEYTGELAMASVASIYAEGVNDNQPMDQAAVRKKMQVGRAAPRPMYLRAK
jgi:hypothetical protein